QRSRLTAAGRSEQCQLFTGHDVKADSAHRRHAAVIDFKPLDLDMRGRWREQRGRPWRRRGHVNPHPRGCALTRRVTATSTITARATTSVWMKARVAVSSELVPNQDSTIEGAITFECGPINKIEAPSSRTLAMNSSNHAAIRPGLSRGIVTVRTRNTQDAPH